MGPLASMKWYRFGEGVRISEDLTRWYSSGKTGLGSIARLLWTLPRGALRGYLKTEGKHRKRPDSEGKKHRPRQRGPESGATSQLPSQ